LAKNYTFG